MYFFLWILSLPPRQSPPEDQPKEEVPKNRCKRFLGCCVKALTCASCTALSSQCCRKEEGENVGCCQNLKNKLSRHPRLVLYAKKSPRLKCAWFGIETRWGLTSKTKMESRNEGFGKSSTVAKSKKWATRAAVSRWGKVGLRSAIKGIPYNLKRKKGIFSSLSLPNILQWIF